MTPVITQNLVSIGSLAAGAPFATFGLNFDIKPGVANTLIVELPTASLAGIAPSLLETIPGTAHRRSMDNGSVLSEGTVRRSVPSVGCVLPARLRKASSSTISLAPG